MDLIPVFTYLLAEEDGNRNHIRLERRILRDNQNRFQMVEQHFRMYFRFPQNIIIEQIIEPLQQFAVQPRRRDHIPFHLKVLAAVNFFANGSDQKAIGNSHINCMSQSSISIAINQVSRLITNHLSNIWIKFPTSREEKERKQEGFYTKWGMRGIIGAIDGTHVEIVSPPLTDEEHQPHLYINRKGRHSINVMLICDSDCNITCISCDITALNARFPGSVHDAAIWQTSHIRRVLYNDYNQRERNHFLIGDSGYGVEPWLFPPVNNAIEDTPEYRYNVLQKRCRNVVERTNGILKSKFHCLSKFRILQYNPVTAAYIIYACGVLHNIARKFNLNEENENEDMPNADIRNDIALNAIDDVAELGRQERNQYIRHNFQ